MNNVLLGRNFKIKLIRIFDIPEKSTDEEIILFISKLSLADIMCSRGVGELFLLDILDVIVKSGNSISLGHNYDDVEGRSILILTAIGYKVTK